VSGASLVFLFCATAFGIVMVMGGVGFGTIETEIWYQTTQLLDLPSAAALSIVQLLVVAASLVLAGRARSRAEHALRLRGDSTAERPWRATDLLPTVLTAVVVVGLLALPLLYLVVRSFVTADGWGLRNYQLLATTGGGSLSVPVWTAVGNSLVIAAQAAALAVLLGALVSVVASRRPRSKPLAAGVKLLDAVFMLPLGVSAVTVGFGFLITLNRPPFDLRSSRRTERPVGVYEGLAGLKHGFATTFIQAKPRAKFGAEDVFFARITPAASAKGWRGQAAAQTG
jgi:thiamine transport system permease protein